MAPPDRQLPRGAIHRFDNHGSQDVQALCAIAPAAIGPNGFWAKLMHWSLGVAVLA